MKRNAALIKKMTTQKLIDKITKQIDQILNESGLIVFSSVDTLVKGDIYTLGLNPGGEAKIPIIKTILEFPPDIIMLILTKTGAIEKSKISRWRTPTAKKLHRTYKSNRL